MYSCQVLCMPTPWSLINVYTAKSCVGGEQDADTLKWDLSAKGENTDREIIAWNWCRTDNTIEKNDLS
jgi:hypothetical protein